MGRDFNELVQKYNVAAPRYTSYPTVPYWETETWNTEQWINHVQSTFSQSSGLNGEGISLYVHLPFCEHLCTYCGCNTHITKNHKLEDPYITAVLREWQLYKQVLGSAIPISELHLGGGTPTFFNPHQLQRLINGLLDGNRVTDEASFSFEAHPANTTEMHLQVLYDAGFRRLSLGIQDFDPDVQRVINRRQTEADVWRVIDQARAIGYSSINFDMIYGLPLQTLDRIADTVAKVLVMRPDRISFYSYAHVPWMKPGQRLFTEGDLPRGNDKLALYQLGRQLILDAGYHDVGMDHFALAADGLFKSAAAGNLHRNFMGYTERYTPLLIGLGVSSISDAWFSFAQNVKKLETYHAYIREYKFPLIKGHVLTVEDLVLRRHILDIMCRGLTVLGNPAAPDVDVLRRLRPMQDDGLITIHGPEVQVTATGRSFLRNICMAFDQRLASGGNKSGLFSQSI